MTEEFLCARCARYTRTCCQDTEIHVTLGDLRRIAPHAAVNDISEFRAPRHPVYDQSLEDPVWDDAHTDTPLKHEGDPRTKPLKKITRPEERLI